MLGLGLVVGIMALLLGGTLLGLLSYMATMKTVGAKVDELKKANDLKAVITQLAAPADAESALTLDEEGRRVQARLQEARQALEEYKAQLQATIVKHRDPEGGYKERQQVDGLQEGFQHLDQAIASFNGKPRAEQESTRHLRDDEEVDAALKGLVDTAGYLQLAIYEDLADVNSAAKFHYKASLIIVLSTSILGVLLMGTLLRFFYGWVFYPIRDLEIGAERVAQGDFDHWIEVHSGDEMEQLAAAFNNMTTRLREIYRDLNRQVNERSRQLVRSERLASVGFLAAGVAHEINNPLQAITLYSGALEARLAELAKRRRPGAAAGAPLSEEEYEVITKYLKTILDEAFRCKRITERLLEFSRGGERHREQVDLLDLVQSVLDVAEPLQNARGKKITFEPAGHVTAWANADEIKSVVLNLVVNALDSMDEGGSLTIRLGADHGMAVLELTDTGCGMNPDVLENIFEPFFTRSRTGKGTGLGLTISHRIITQHGGEIEAASPGPGQGSTFTVRLPREPAPDSEASAKAAETEKTAAGKRQAA
jgi:signal transduction histidine kinase